MASSENTPLFHWHITGLNSDDSKFYNRGLFLLIIFFSVIIITATLFLYTHWVCRGRRFLNTTTTSDTSSTTILSQDSQGLDPETIDSLPVIVVTMNTVGGAVSETECSICLCKYEDKEKVKVLPLCNHAYHSECVDKWFSSQSSCPLCRASLVQAETARGKNFV